MTETLFGNVVPAITDGVDGVANYALGTRFTCAVDGQLTHGRWRFPDTTPSPTAQVQIGVYRVSDQALLGSTVFPLAATVGAWNEVAFPAPIPVVAGVMYAVVIWTPLRYAATANYTWPAQTANLTAAAANGWFETSPGALVFPTAQSGSGASYFADVVFASSVLADAQLITPVGVASAGAVGQPSTQAGRVTTTPVGVPTSSVVGTSRVTPRGPDHAFAHRVFASEIAGRITATALPDSGVRRTV